jgi:hypothetical protein
VHIVLGARDDGAAHHHGRKPIALVQDILYHRMHSSFLKPVQRYAINPYFTIQCGQERLIFIINKDNGAGDLGLGRGLGVVDS